MGAGRIPAALRGYMAAASPMIAYGLLAFFWWFLLRQFWGAMTGRLRHFGAGGMRFPDPPCGCPQCDFSAFWPAGVLVRAGRVAQLYDPAAFLRFRQGLFWPQVAIAPWFYPPPTLLPVAALSFFPFEMGFWVWTVALVGLAVMLLRRAGISWAVVVVSMLSPAALWNLELGELGTATGGMVVSSAMLADAAPVLAGLLLGALAIKPQSAIALGFGLLGRRRYWAGLAAAGAAALGLVAAATLLAGWQVWPRYFEAGMRESKYILQGAGQEFGISVFWALRMAGAGVAGAYVGQAAAAVSGVAVVWKVWRDEDFKVVERMAVTVFCSLLATPYGYTDDMVGYAVALAALAEARGWRIDLVDVFLWLWPALCPVVYLRTGLLFTPLVVGVALGRVWWGAKARRAALG